MLIRVIGVKLQEVTKLTKQLLMEEALSEQMKERQEMERKLQKLSKTMDHLERAKREEERPLIEEAYRKRLRDDESFYQQQQEVWLSVTGSIGRIFNLRRVFSMY